MKIQRRVERPAAALFVGVLVLELRRIPKPQNLSAGVAGQDAVWALGLERYHGHIPRPRPIGRRDAAARQPFERFELEYRRRGSYVVRRPVTVMQRSRR